MSNVQKVSIALTAEFIALLQEAIDSGEYTSASEVVRDALRDWKTRRGLHDLDAAELRKLWDEGIRSGPGRVTSFDRIKKEARRRASKTAKA
jgi:antitoxin ParD1/3/4